MSSKQKVVSCHARGTLHKFFGKESFLPRKEEEFCEVARSCTHIRKIPCFSPLILSEGLSERLFLSPKAPILYLKSFALPDSGFRVCALSAEQRRIGAFLSISRYGRHHRIREIAAVVSGNSWRKTEEVAVRGSFRVTCCIWKETRRSSKEVVSLVTLWKRKHRSMA